MTSAVNASDTTTKQGSLRRRRRTLGLVALAASALLIAGAGVGLLTRRAARVREAVRAIEAAGGVVTWDYEYASLFAVELPAEEREKVWRAFLYGGPTEDLDRDGRAWLRRLLGPEWFHDVAALNFLPAEGSPGSGPALSEIFAVHLPAFPRLKRLLIREEATDRTLEAAGRLRELENLIVRGVSMTDEGLRHLGRLSRLQSLYVQSSLITDAGVRHLVVLDKLETLTLRGTQVTDRGTTALLELKSLRSLSLDGRHITENGLEMLRAMLPGVQVSR
jgi:hypothetical protein